MTDWLNPYRWLLLLALSGSLTLGYFAWASHQQGIGEARAAARYEAALTKQKADAAALLAKETAKVHATEASLQKFHFDQEFKDLTNEKTIAILAGKLHRASGISGRLRDPNAEAGCRSGGGGAQGQGDAGTGDRPGDGGQASGLFSAAATRLFERITGEADTINRAYAACRADSLKLRETLALP